MPEIFFFFLRSKTVGSDLSAGSRSQEAGDAEPGVRAGRPAQRRRTRGGSVCPRPRHGPPAALLDRSPAPAARNKVYVLLRPHPPPPTQDRASPRPAPPNSTWDPSTTPASQPAQQRDTPTGEEKYRVGV
ncbi:uncharacterized protein RBU33_019418 [Hipposideros larvatus]